MLAPPRLAVLARLAFFAALIPAPVLLAQTESDGDPLKGTRKLGDSAEILLLWSNEENTGTRYQTVYDYLNLNNPNPDVPNELRASDTQSVSSGSVPQNESALDVISGDFDDDGRDDYVAVWEGPDRSIEMIAPALDRAALVWTEPHLTTIAPSGSLMESSEFERTIRLASGDFDDDRASEFLLAYFGADSTLEISLYALDAHAPRQLSSFREPAFKHLDSRGPNTPYRSSRWFDVNAGDFDGDGTDEVIAVGATAFSCSFNLGCWNVVARVYDVHPQSFELTLRAEQVLFTKEDNSADFANRFAVESGRFGSEFEEGAALVFQRTDNNSQTRWYLAMSRVLLARDEEGAPLAPELWGSSADTSRFEVGPDGMDLIHQTNGSRGFALSAQSVDFHGDGIEELVLLHRVLEIYRIDETYAPTSVSTGNASTDPGDAARHALAVADLDADNDLNNESSSWLPEILTVENSEISDDGGIDSDGILRIRAIGWNPDVGFNNRLVGEISDQRHEVSGGRPVVIAAVDVSDDAIRVGPPRHSARTDIVRPLVILNAPPTHFDVIDGELFDVNQCYGAEDCACQAARARCFQAEYSTETERSITMETELTTDWSIATTVSGGFKIPLIKTGVDVSITGRYGAGFRRTGRSTETFTVRQAIQATRDDWIYAMIVNYDIWEYPLFAEGEQVGYIAVVIPKLNTRAWFDSKSWNAFDYVPFHEVGNVLSYRSIANPNDNALLEEAIRWNTGDQITLSSSSDAQWALTSESQSETEVENSVDMGINGTVDFDIDVPFVPNVSVEGDYSTETINTQTTRVRDTQGLSVVFGNVDQSIGNTRYNVIPYVYWATNGALVLDYAVNPELAQPGFEDTWWQTTYGQRSDPAFILPWRHDNEKGQVVTEAQMHQTRDILIDPLEPEAGDVVTIRARLHNWSLVPTPEPVEVRFFVGDPAAGGTPIVGVNGETSVLAPQLTDRGSAVVQMQWQVPSGIGLLPRIYAVLDAANTLEEIHESNNKGWTVLNMASFPTDLEPDSRDELPARAQLFQNYPNPFQNSTTIGFEVAEPGRVRLQILDVLGRRMATVVDREMTAGSYNVAFDARGLSSGIYFYRLEIGGVVRSKSMVLQR